MNGPSNTGAYPLLVVRGDARRLPLRSLSVDLVVTSPPYFGLRSYQDGGQHYAGQVGDEATPAEFVAALLDVTRECVRVLKPSGSIWVNLGDKYAGGGMGGHSSALGGAKPQGEGNDYKRTKTDVRSKSLIGLPWRYALACIDDLGLILRAEVIWSKPNGLPESVTDRVRRSHEQWFHFTKEPRYFSAVDEVREEYADLADAKRPRLGQNQQHSPLGGSNLNQPGGNPLGKLPGSVWTIPTQPLQVPASLGVDHFAAFPMEWPRRIIRGWSPSGICVECGEGRRPVTESLPVEGRAFAAAQQGDRGREWHGGDPAKRTLGVAAEDRQRTITGEACHCSSMIVQGRMTDLDVSQVAPSTRPAVVLDPFGGTGTTALVASALGRVGISCDLSHDYSRLARWRTTDSGQRAAAMQVEKPKQELPGQVDLFGGAA